MLTSQPRPSPQGQGAVSKQTIYSKLPLSTLRKYRSVNASLAVNLKEIDPTNVTTMQMKYIYTEVCLARSSLW